MSLHLLLLPRVHDLPPKWDGRTVEWETGWCPQPWHHFPPDVCDKCGHEGFPLWGPVGTIHPLPGDMFTDRVERRTKSGRAYLSSTDTTTFPAYPVARLTAYRCQECGHDHIIDRGMSEEWSEWCLDPFDYLDGGSDNPEPQPLF